MDTKRCRRTILPVLTGVFSALLVLAFASAPVMAQVTATPKPTVLPRPSVDCHDDDGDGYGSPGNPACSNGGEQDCDDTVGSVNPGASESCNGVDDDCDGNVDEAFVLSKESANSGDYDCQDGIDNDGDGKVDQLDPQCAAAICSIGDPAGCSTGDPGGCCLTGASTVCKADGTGTECVILPDHVQHLQHPEPAAFASEASCFDGEDNDCDGLTDHQEPSCQTAELCDGFDNNGDGLVDNAPAFANKGLPCFAGVGVCRTNGIFVCNADGSALECTAVAGIPGIEGPAGNGRCSDGKDNDCDTLTDLADPNCQTAEVCDGLDNDGNDGADEDFTDLGDPCSIGVGACASTGVRVCKSDGTGTVCNAAAKSGTVEGPSGPTCTDGVDNDCDGTTDLADAACASSQLAVECSLRFVNGQPGSDCEGWHTINYEVHNGGPATDVKAELLGIGLDGLVIDARTAKAGDQVHLVSRLSPTDWKFTTRSSAKGTKHEVYAPVPMLRITATDGPNTAYAYCSNIPYLYVIRPSGDVVSASESTITPVFAAIPRVDPATLEIKVDGVDIVAGLGLDPATDFPGGPYSGNVNIGGVSVAVNDLTVGSGGVASLASNTVSFSLDGLGCGGHIVSITGDPQAGSRKTPTSLACDTDDLADSATSIVFTIEITNPTSGQITNVVPTPVEGVVCGGSHIAELSVNGKTLDPEAGQVVTPGDGVTTGDKVTLNFSTKLNQTDLAAEVAGTNTEAFTLDPGSNYLYVRAADDEGNATYDALTFAVGDVSKPGSLAPSAQNELAALLDATAREAFLSHIKPAAGNLVPNAFAMGMTKPALDTFFTQTCANANADTKAQILSKLVGKKFPGKEVEVDAACNPTASTTIKDVTFNGDFTCSVELADNLITMTAFVPEMTVFTNTYGYCCDGCDFICWSEVIVDVDIDFTIPKPGAQPIRFVFPVDEAHLLNGGDINGQFVKPSAIADGHVSANRSEVNCFSAVANFFITLGKAIVDGLVFIFTFGQVDPPFDLGPSFDDVANSDDLNAQLQIEEFPVAMKGIKPDAGAVADTGKLLTTTPTSVDIKSDGVTIGLDGQFSSTFTDPDTLDNPGAVSNPAPMPAASQPPPAGNTYFVMTDDIVNQLFAAMQAQGEFNTVCKPSGKTVGDFLEPDCSTLDTAIKRGICQGQKRVDCGTITEPLAAAQVIARGACYGATHEHTFCATLGAGNGETICNSTPFLNLFADQKFLFCGQMNTPPRLLLHDDPGTSGVIESDLRFKNFLVGVVLDRNLDDTVASLATVGTCTGTTAEINGDCKFAAVCVDFELITNWSLANEGGKLRIRPDILGKREPPPPHDPGSICAGGTPVTSPPAAGSGAVGGPSPNDAGQHAEGLTPPFQTDGLDLNGIVKFANPRLIVIETDGKPEFQDFFGITGEIVAP
jgi:hypothetical protein